MLFRGSGERVITIACNCSVVRVAVCATESEAWKERAWGVEQKSCRDVRELEKRGSTREGRLERKE